MHFYICTITYNNIHYIEKINILFFINYLYRTYRIFHIYFIITYSKIMINDLKNIRTLTGVVAPIKKPHA